MYYPNFKVVGGDISCSLLDLKLPFGNRSDVTAGIITTSSGITTSKMSGPFAANTSFSLLTKSCWLYTLANFI